MDDGIGASHDVVRLGTLGRLALDGPGAELGSVLRRPKTLALLVLLAITSRDGCVRRDRLVGILWADLDQKRARAALRNAVYLLRRALPAGAIVSEGDEMLRVDAARVRTDAVEFEGLVGEGALEAALEVYRGDFMPGFHLDGPSEFDAWRDSRERAYRRAALAAATSLAARARDGGRADDVLRWLERAVALAPFDEEPTRRLITALLERGDRGAARAAYDAHAARLRHLEMTPARATTALLSEAVEADAYHPGPPPRDVRTPPALVEAEPATERQHVVSGPAVAEGVPIPPGAADGQSLRTRWFAAGAGLAAVMATGLAFGGSWLEAHRARTDGFAAFRADVARGAAVAAFERGLELRAWLAGNAEFEALWHQVTAPATIRTSPQNATISVQEYASPDGPWVTLGTTPLERVPLPAAYLRWRIERPGHAPVERAGFDLAFRSEITFHLPESDAPPGMAYVSGDAINVGAPLRMRLEPFWLDRTEVSNAEYLDFVEQGGYGTLDVPAGDGGLVRSPFVDKSGLPGPATWSGGTWPVGERDHPVRGVSWFEAEAYCAWAGKELPTAYHWFAAGGYAGYADIVTRSNFSHGGPTAVGAAGAIGPYGHHDLAGNVREWVASEISGLRAMLGGAWDTPSYHFMAADAVAPLDRSDHNGFRCARVTAGPKHPARAPLRIGPRMVEGVPDGAPTHAEPVDRFDYDPAPLRETVESTSDAHPVWRRELVTFDAAYGGERMSAAIYLPKHGSPPYSAVVFHPGADAGLLPSFTSARTSWFDFLSRGNYAVIYPVYKGTYERRTPLTGPIGIKDQVIHRVKDLRRALDYAETRDDLDLSHVTYYGFSQGAILAPIVAVVEPRIDAAVVLSGGLNPERIDEAVEPRNFLRSADRPLLMVGGELDFLFPFETAQRPYFDAWGAPRDEKLLVSMPFGHTPREMGPIAIEVLAWLASLTSAGEATRPQALRASSTPTPGP